MAKSWQLVVGVLVVLGVPTAVGTAWRHLIATHKVEALLLAIVWLLICTIVFLAQKALADPFNRRLAQAGNAADRAASWWLSGYRHRYRRWVLDSRRYLDIKDLATSGDHTPELDDVYVDVALVKRAPQQVSGNPLSGIPEDATGRHSLSDFLNKVDHAVLAIVGPPGSGKSTLLAHAALQGASTSKGRLPVLLALREHGATIAADSSIKLPDLIRSAVQGVPGTEPDGWWDRQLEQGRCVIMLDGLDEVAKDEDRRAVATWAEKQIATYPGNHFVITSRPHGFPSLVIKQASVLTIRPFTSDQIARFLHRWYFATERHATSATTLAQVRSARMLAEVGADKLITLLRAHPALHDLTVNPLLLTMIATVHRYRGALPGSRAELYGEICQVMLSRRIQAKDMPEILPWEAKRKILAALAYQMTKDHVTELPEDAVLKIIEHLLAGVPQSISSRDFLADISNNGLLVSPAANRYSFPHRTFQEYLTAQYIRDTPTAAEAIASSVEDPWWRETILLYAATSSADRIVSACLEIGSITTLALAFECAEISHELSADLRGRLDQAREEAFELESTPEHRRLIAGVLATRFTRETIFTESNTRICARPIPADLYWLFLQDTKSPPPDAPCAPTPSRAALGMWVTEAIEFINWLNSITFDSAHSGFHLPDVTVLSQETVISALARNLHDEITGVWASDSESGDRSASLVQVSSDRPSPYEISRRQIHRAIEIDIEQTGILDPVRAARIMNAAIKMLIALDPDTGMEGNSIRRVVLPHIGEVAQISIDSEISHIAAELSSDTRRVSGYRFNSPSLTGRSIPRVRQIAGLAAEALKLEAETFIQGALSHVPGREAAFRNDFDAAYRSILTALNENHVTYNGIPQIPLIWLAEGPLGLILHDVYVSRADDGSSADNFAKDLTSAAEVPTVQVSSALVRPPIFRSFQVDSGGHSQVSQPGKKGSFFPLATALRILDATAAQVLSSPLAANTPTGATLRIVALALASDSRPSEDEKADKLFHWLAAATSLLQLRAQREAEIGECIVPALD